MQARVRLALKLNSIMPRVPCKPQRLACSRPSAAEPIRALTGLAGPRLPKAPAMQRCARALATSGATALVKEPAFAKGVALKPSSGQVKPQGNQTERQWSSGGSLVLCGLPGFYVAGQLHVGDDECRDISHLIMQDPWDIGTAKLF